MEFTLVKADPDKKDIYYDILDDARTFQREQGFTQWSDDYPNAETVPLDIAEGRAYELRAENEAAGYMYINFDGDSDYNHIRGAWGTPERYAAVHRLAIARKFRNQGVSYKAFALIEKLCKEKGVAAIRIDTDFPNKRMQHILEKSGFTFRGIVNCHGDRKAYDKNI